MTLPLLEEFLRNSAFSVLDRHFARWVESGATAQSRLCGHAAALTSLALRHGYPCLRLDGPVELDDIRIATDGLWPSLSEWRSDLLQSGVVAESAESFLPLVLDGAGRLYLHRYADYERRLATKINERVSTDRFSVIVGGPGTGKTHSILQILIDRMTRNPELRIALAAPTGKAAQRMEESICRGISLIEAPGPVVEDIPRVAMTLHRLLGSRGDSAFFRHDATNPLPFDLVIVDEASMVDLPLMSKLLDALPQNGELLVVGDPDQLSSVEAGAVLADIVAAAESAASADGPLAKNVRRLRTQYRYGNNSGIGRLCDAIRSGDVATVMGVLQDSTYADVRWQPLPTHKELGVQLRQSKTFGLLREIFLTKDPKAQLALLSQSRILCPTRLGTYGVQSINTIVERLLQAEELIDTDQADYPGRPVLVVRNDYGLQLFNGDTGVITESPSVEDLQVYFQHGRAEGRRIAASRLPPNQTSFAMTVHRCQGSEFDRVLLLLPPGNSPILTRELLYTAVSRAKADVEIWCDREALEIACTRRMRRSSGLQDRLIP